MEIKQITMTLKPLPIHPLCLAKIGVYTIDVSTSFRKKRFKICFTIEIAT